MSFADDLAMRIARQRMIAHDPRNLVDETQGESLVGMPILTTSGKPVLHKDTGQIMYETPPRHGWVPTVYKTVGGPPTVEFMLRIAPPDTWQQVDNLYPYLRIKAHQAGWETPVALVYHLVKVNRDGLDEAVVLRVITIQFDLRDRVLPAMLKGMEPMLQQMASGLSEPYLEGMTNVGWSMDCGEPVPVTGHQGVNAGNVSWRTPVMLRIIAQHDDPEGAAIVATAKKAGPVLT